MAGDGRRSCGSNAYHSMAATPLRPARSPPASRSGRPPAAAIAVAGVAVVLALFDETRSWGLLLAIPFAVLTGLAFSVPITAWSSTRAARDSRSRRSSAS